MNAYFIPGMCVNCSVFDRIKLPKEYTRKYIEWFVPQGDETIEEYARKMADGIDKSEPFVLIGYSLGGVIMQEMNRFLRPVKNILISSMKCADEIPAYFRFAHKAHLPELLPDWVFHINETVAYLFSKLVYDMNEEDIEKYVSCVDPVYLRWATSQIMGWEPHAKCKNIFHIHGTNDQVFPFKRIHGAYAVKDGDHLMVMRKAEELSEVLEKIL